MLPFGEVEFSTTNKDLWEELFNLHIEGVTAEPKLEKGFKGDKLIFKAIIHFAYPVAIGYFGNWLYDHHGRHSESEAKIEGQCIPKERPEINVIIMEKITINNSYRIKAPERERVPEE